MNLFFPWKERALFARLVAHCNHVVEHSSLELHDAFRAVGGEVDADFSHDSFDVEVNLGWGVSCAFRFEPVSAQVVYEPFCHLGTGGVVCAEK